MLNPDSPTVERPPYLAATFVSAGLLVLYTLTIAPTTQFWDTSEYIAAAKVLGIPHPPGNPLFVLLANVWGKLPIVEHYALRINLFAAVTSALASGLLFLVAERFLREMIPDRVPRYAAAVAGIVVGATSFTVWNQSTVNEKVYTLSLVSIALILWLAVRWGDTVSGPKRDRLLILIVYLCALSATNHQMGLLAVPAVLTYVVWSEPRVFLRWRMWIAFAVVSIVGVSVWVFLPIRAGLYPPINEGEPTTWEALKAVLSREQYQKGPLIPRQADIWWQYLNYLQYFTWQFGRDWAPEIRRVLAVVFGALGLFGGIRLWRADRRSGTAMAALMVTVTVALVFYLDFKYGFSMRPSGNVATEVRERDYFFVASFLLWGVWVALGFGALLRIAAARFAALGERRWRPAMPVLALCLIPLWGNHLSASRSGERLPRDVAWDILQSVEPYGILITAGDNDTFPLWYAQEVEGVRKDIVVANLSLMNTDWHNRQIKRREIFRFDESESIPLYRGGDWVAPTESPLSLSYEEIDALPPYLEIRERRLFRHDSIEAVIEPGFLERADFVTLQLLRDNLGARPIYISRTTGNYGERMGLAPYLLGQGLVRKLMPTLVTDSDSTVLIGGLGWMDIERTGELLFGVYHAESAARERPLGWIDIPSESILSLYGLLYAAYAEALSSRASDSLGTGLDSTAVARIQDALELSDRIFRNTSFR